MSKALAPQQLVAEGAQLRDRMAADKKRLDEINSALIDLGGSHEHDGHKALVITPSDSVTFPKDAEDQEKARSLAGDAFAKLFEKTISFSPTKAFREVAAAVLTKSQAAKLIDLCSVAKSPYVKWS